MSSKSTRVAVLLAITLATSPSLARYLIVPTEFPTIAAALDVAVAGDFIMLAPGTYREHDLPLKSGIGVLGDPAQPGLVTIDAGGLGRVLRAESLAAPVAIRGVRLTGGLAQGANAHASSGGALLIDRAEVRLEDCIIEDNAAAGNGGGLRVASGAVSLSRCVVRRNVAGLGGGGLEVGYQATATVTDSDLAGNHAAWGGAVAVRNGSTASIDGTYLVGNRALHEPGLGGAVASDYDAKLTITGCVLADNQALYGGGVFMATGAEVAITSVTIDRNESTVAGGGLYGKDSSLRLERSIVSFHAQEGISLGGASVPLVSESNIFGNAADWVGALADQLGRDRNFSADPRYCGPGERGLQPDSPCALENNGFALVGALGVGCRAATEVPPPPLPALALGAQPNPFNPQTEIVYDLAEGGHVRLSIYDPRGRRLGVLVDAIQPAGPQGVVWLGRDQDGRALASGVYIAVLEHGNRRVTTKLTLAR